MPFGPPAASLRFRDGDSDDRRDPPRSLESGPSPYSTSRPGDWLRGLIRHTEVP